MSADELLKNVKKGMSVRKKHQRITAKFPERKVWEEFFAWERPQELAKLRQDIRKRWQSKVITECVDVETGTQYSHPVVPQITVEE